jgi:D-threo-aldose 1-dehydrogenase
MAWRDVLDRNPLGFGTMAIGGQVRGISDEAALATLRAAYQAGIRTFDTAPQYGCGLAEERLGLLLREVPRKEVVIASKVGKRIAPLGTGGQRQRDVIFPGGHDAEMVFDYSADGTQRIVEASLKRLRTDRLDLVLIHDVIRHFHGEDGVHARFEEARDGAVVALRRLQDEGVVGAIGSGLKDVDIAVRFVEECEAEVVLLPGRLTLLEQSALTSGLADLCAKHGTALIAAAPFDSGILATGSEVGGTYAYRPADGDILTRVRALEAICARHGVPLQAVALQFPRLHPAVTTVLAGMRHAEDVRQNAAWMATRIPPVLWAELASACGLVLPSV